jgi:RNA-directed DNA polymerase
LLTLTVLEQLIKSIARKSGDEINFIGYADDFVITGTSKEVLTNEIKPQLINFLQERGLTLSEERTHITDGFDFLGFNVRKYNDKLLIKPSKNNVLLSLGNMR